MKRIKAMVCAIVMAVVLLGSAAPTEIRFMPDPSVTASAAAPVWDGTADTSWYYREHTTLLGKSTTEGEAPPRFAVFNIGTAEELAGLAKLVRNGNQMENVVINLTSDIVLNDTSNFENWDKQPPANNWTAIGAVPLDVPNEKAYSCRNTEFFGIFNGNGHTISGMYSMHHNFAGLFATVTGAVTSVVLEDSYVKCTNTQKTSGGDTVLWNTYAGGIAAVCDRGIINRCSFDGKVFASGQNLQGYGTHGCYAGGIVGQFADDDRGIAVIVCSLVALPAGIIINPLIFAIGSGGLDDNIQNPGIYNCMNKGEIYAENGTWENGAGGIVGTGGLYTFMNPDFAVFYCLNTGKIAANHENVGGMVGNGYKFSEQKSYYTNCTRSSQNNAATNFTEAGMSLKEVAEALGDAYQYKNGEISLNFDGLQPQAPDETLETERFSVEKPERNVTLPAPEVSCAFLTHYFGTVVDSDNISVSASSTENISNWWIEVAGDPGFTDVYVKSFTLYDVPAEETYYMRVWGKSEDGAYTEYRYLNLTLREDGTIDVKDGLDPNDVLGDINADGTFGLADMIALQKWILMAPNAALPDWKAADFNGDQVVNVMDLAMMKQMVAKAQ